MIALEESVLGGIMLAAICKDNASITSVIEALPQEAFSDPRLRTIYRTIRTIYSDGRMPDPITVSNTLRADLEAVGGVAYVSGLPNLVPAVHLLPQYVEQLLDRLCRQKMSEIAERLQHGATNGESRSATVAECINLLQQIDSERSGLEPAPVGIVLAEWRSADEWVAFQAPSKKALIDGVIYPRSIHVLAGPTGIGKTCLSLQLTTSVSRGTAFLGWHVPEPHPALYVNLELPDWELQNRLRVLGTPPFLIVGNVRGLNVEKPDHAAYIEAQVRKTNAKLLVIDTLSRAHRADEQDATATQQVMAIFETWAARLGIAILLIHHTRKQPKNGRTWRLTVDDVRGSGVWTAHASVVIVLSQNPDDEDDYSASFKNNFVKCPPRQFRRHPNGTFGATAWNRTLSDADIQNFLTEPHAPMNESEVARLLAERHSMNPGSVRNRLSAARVAGALNDLWVRTTGQAVLYRGRRGAS